MQTSDWCVIGLIFKKADLYISVIFMDIATMLSEVCRKIQRQNSKWMLARLIVFMLLKFILGQMGHVGGHVGHGGRT